MVVASADRLTLHECPGCARSNAPDAQYCCGCGEPLVSVVDSPVGGAEADPLLGTVIAERYRIEELLGRGGMGVVYRVEHVQIGKLMAVKLLHGGLARDRDVARRFRREAEAISKLDHPNTVQIFDFGKSGAMMYLCMEYLPGKDLGTILKDQGRLSFERIAAIGIQICESVAQAHERGIVHRDLKPENIMVLDGPGPDFIKVLDFGLAKLRNPLEAEERRITAAGVILGTPYYMAPEHIRGEEVDARADVYAVGALIYKAITGATPFRGASPLAVLSMHLTQAVQPPSERVSTRPLPPAADAIVLKAMEKDPDKRFQSMGELREALLDHLISVGQSDGQTEGSARLRFAAHRGARTAGLGAGIAHGDAATRGDIDHYERRIRRRHRFGMAALFLFLAGGIAAGGWLWTQRSTLPDRVELEPNNTLSEATPLPPSVPYEAYLGRRLSTSHSDADFFQLDNPGGERRIVRIEVGAIPNMDLTFELYRQSMSVPLLRVNNGGRGEAESVPNFVIEGPRYYLRVRELWESGQWPTENVSDPYRVHWRFVSPEPEQEREVNDLVSQAEHLSADLPRVGFVGWSGDVDTYCLRDATADVVVRLSGVPRIDLVLEVLNRVTGAVEKVNSHGVGEGERTGIIGAEDAARTCLRVSAGEGGASSDSDGSYTLTREAAE